MYITFYTQKQPEQVTMADILKNTRSQVTNKSFEKQKITKDIEEGNWKVPEYITRPERVQITLPEGYKTEEHYSHFQIPKKSNPKKKRKIDAPDDELKEYQRYYKKVLEQYLRVLPHNAANAYVENRSTVTAMKEHQKNNSKWFLQLDLKDFFNSINEEWIKNMLPKIYPFKHYAQQNPEEYESMIKSALLKGVLPQGSVLSPTLTNILMVPIDHQITEKLRNFEKHHYVYTRYADDMTISCKEKFDPEVIVRIIKEIFDYFNAPFGINNEKTRFGSIAGKNYHVGIILNKDNKLSVGHEKNKRFRAMINNFCLVGEEWDKHEIQKMLGLISYYKAIEPNFVEKVLKQYGSKYNIDIKEKANYYLSNL